MSEETPGGGHFGDAFSIAAATFAAVALVFAVFAFVFSSQATERAQSTKDEVANKLATGPAATSTTTASTVPAGHPSVHVSEREYSIVPDVVSVASGAVRFQVSNTGLSGHEFVVVRTELDPRALPVNPDLGTVITNAVGIERVGAVDTTIKPGTTKTGSFDLKPGNYVLFCNLPGHYQQGMAAHFTAT
jgi:uncharacterized cupredoxin-like copper-binding protein